MSELDKDLEEQIDKLISDFKSKITRIVSKNQNKLLKEQYKSLKDEMKNNNISSSPKRTRVKPVAVHTSSKSRKSRDYESDDSDSD